MINEVEEFLKSNKDKRYVFLLIDKLDSGLSIDNIRNIQNLFKTWCELYSNLYIINAINNYEFTIGAKSIIAHTGKYVTVDSYEKFANIQMMKRYRYPKTPY